MTRAVAALLGFVGGVACALGVALTIAIARAPAPAGPAVIRWRGGAVRSARRTDDDPPPGDRRVRAGKRVPGESPLATGSARHKGVHIEDNPSNVAFVRDLVENLPSVELLTAPTAAIGLELIRSHAAQVVIMDINLPGMSGFDAVQRLHEWPETRNIPVIGCRRRRQRCSKDTRAPRRSGFIAT
jgi:response regulator receiver domain-containing protein